MLHLTGYLPSVFKFLTQLNCYPVPIAGAPIAKYCLIPADILELHVCITLL